MDKKLKMLANDWEYWNVHIVDGKCLLRSVRSCQIDSFANDLLSDANFYFTSISNMEKGKN